MNTAVKSRPAQASIGGWRNLWRVRIPYDDLPAGHEYWDCDVWPSQQQAEQAAREELAWDAAHGAALVEDWAGAYPVNGPTKEG